MALSVSIELVSSLARVTSVKSTKGLSVTDGHPDTKIGPGHLGPIKTNEGAEVQAMCKSVQKVNKIMSPEDIGEISGYRKMSQTTTTPRAPPESPRKPTIYKSLGNNYMKPNPGDLKEESTVFASNGDLEALDEKVKSLMQKSQNMVSNGPLMKTTAFICKVCGKEGRPTQIRDHIEAKHLDDIALPCDKILAVSGVTCGKIFSGRRGLLKHKTRFH